MNQGHKTTITRPVPIERNRLVTGAAVFVATIVLATAAGLAIISASAVTRTAPPLQQRDAEDGWGPAMADRAAARVGQIQDGYMPGLLGGRNTGDAVDGWESSLTR